MNPQARPQAVAVVGQALMAPWVDAEARETILKLADDTNELAGDIEAASVADTASAARVTELLTLAATTQKRVEEARRRITDPLKSQAKSVEDAVRPLTVALDALVTAGKRKVLEWQRAEAQRVRREREERERQEAEARRKAEEAAAAGRRPAPAIVAALATLGVLPPVAEVPRGVRTDYGTASVRKRWDFEIVDVSKLPPAFVMPNEKAIRAAVHAGAREIAGVRIFETDELAVRAAR